MKYSLLLLLVVLTGCQKSTPTTFQLNVEADSLADANFSENKLTFKAPANAEVIVESDGDKSVVNIDELNSDGQFTVTLAVTREASDLDGKSKFTTMIRPQSPTGASAGGPSTFTKSSELDLTDIMLIDVDSGEYSLGRPVQIGTLNGTPIHLTVRPTTANSE